MVSSTYDELNRERFSSPYDEQSGDGQLAVRRAFLVEPYGVGGELN